jgi:short-subunit dehydrogenase/SAM-dependent methyltransferase/dTDP-4-dehydrorhamnose reductase
MHKIKRIKTSIHNRYRSHRSTSFAQTFLKVGLVPLRDLDARLPADGVILDLGCGEGILTNLVGEIRPDCRVIGIDRDFARLELAKLNAGPNVSFKCGDIFSLDIKMQDVSAVIMNDVVHHQPYDRHQALIALALQIIRPGGMLVLKEVDQLDKVDAGMTRFFDSRLYPSDPLCFRGKNEWIDLLMRLGAPRTEIETFKSKYFWPASRTLFFIRRSFKCIDLFQDAVRIGVDNKSSSVADDKFVVFVTGATGFLGCHLCAQLLTEGLVGKKVRLIYLSRNPSRTVPELQNAIPIYGDLQDTELLRHALIGVQYVFHLAAEVKLTNGADIWRNNYLGTLSLLDALKNNSSLKRFIHASTIGAVDRMPGDDCSNPLTEEANPNPLSEYGKTKLESEMAVQKSSLPYSILRITWGFGKGMTPDTHVRFLTNGVVQNKLFSRISFPGEVSVVSAHDIIDALELIALTPDAKNEIYFVSAKQLSLGDLFKSYAQILRKKHSMICVPSFLSAPFKLCRRYLPLQIQALFSNILSASPEKINKIGFCAGVGLREGLLELARDQGHLPKLVGKRPISIITGASGGIGRALAIQMEAEGHRLLLVDVNQDALLQLANRLSALHLVADLSTQSGVDLIENYLELNGLYVDCLINNAGIGDRGALAESNPSKMRAMVEVNCNALVALSSLFSKQTRLTGVGTLVNIGSSSGFQPLPYMAVYAATKAFVQSFTLALAAELRGKGAVRVILIDPSGVDTGFQNAAGVKKSPGEKLLTPEIVASEILKAIATQKELIIIGKSGKMMELLSRILPRAFQARLWAYLMAKMR